MPTQDKPHNVQSSDGQNFPANHYHTHPAQGAQLSMIATPIGNLGDISRRALDTLQACDEVWCEDTRHTQALLHALKIPHKRLRRVDQHTPIAEIKSLLKDLSERRQHVGVVSDAGTPGVSDPGAKVIEQAIHFPEIKIVPIPGSSAVTALLSVAGVHENAFGFLGFFPREESDALETLNKIVDSSLIRSFVFFESPNRIRETLAVLVQWTKAVLEKSEGTISFVFAKEITKIHESLWVGQGWEFLHAILHQHFDVPEKSKGEWCFVINLSNLCVINEKPVEDWAVTLECLISAGISTKESAALVSQRFSVAKNLAYKKAIELKEKDKNN